MRARPRTEPASGSGRRHLPRARAFDYSARIGSRLVRDRPGTTVRITFLGSGAAFCDYRVNYHNNAVIDTAEGPVLIDCGTTACQSLKELGLQPAQVRAVLFTHLHADHASPEQLVWERFYGGPPEDSAFQQTELVGPSDLVETLLGALRPYLDEFTDRQYVVRRGGVDASVVPKVARETEIGGVRFRWFRVPHVSGELADKAAYGLDIDDGATRVLWSGDTTFAPRWVLEAADDPRVARIFHECTFLAPFRGTVHTHHAQLATLPERVRARLTLMHHTAVPQGVALTGFAGAARRHEVFDL